MNARTPACGLMMLLCAAGAAPARQTPAPGSGYTWATDPGGTPARVECGPCSMAFAAQILGVPVTDAELNALVDPTGVTTFADLARFARRKNLHAEAFTMTPAQLARLERVAILQLVVRTGPANEWREHFVTWAGPGHAPATGVVFDPVTSRGRGEVPLKILAATWTGAALVISDGPIDSREITGESGMLPGALRAGAFGSCLGSAAAAGLFFVRSRRGRRSS